MLIMEGSRAKKWGREGMSARQNGQNGGKWDGTGSGAQRSDGVPVCGEGTVSVAQVAHRGVGGCFPGGRDHGAICRPNRAGMRME